MGAIANLEVLSHDVLIWVSPCEASTAIKAWHVMFTKQSEFQISIQT